MTRTTKQPLIVSVAAALFLAIVVLEALTPANVVIAYGFVVPILLVATVRDRRLMYLTVLLCVLATYSGLLRPTKPGRFMSAVINRTVVAGVLVGVAYLAMTREERKAREEDARAALAMQTEHLLRANAQLAEIKDALNRSERLAAVGRLVASVAHEVGTPLHSIAWHVHALGEEACLTADMRTRLDVIDSQIARVVRIIEDLLVSTRQRKPHVAALAAEQLIHPVVGLMGPVFSRKDVRLTVRLSDDVRTVWGDVEQLQQVLVNLLTNALAATGAGGEVVVDAVCRPATPEEIDTARRVTERSVATMTVIVVHDTGCGMPPEHIARTAEPFFTTKAIGDGTGLGLFLSREIVTAHGGALAIESEVGKGTTVTLALPHHDEAVVESVAGA
jgi:signal transduction histidine kinase